MSKRREERSVTVSFRFPLELVEALDRVKDSRGTTRCAVVKSYLAASVGLEVEKAKEPLLERMIKAEDRIVALESQIKVLTSLLKEKL